MTINKLINYKTLIIFAILYCVVLVIQYFPINLLVVFIFATLIIATIIFPEKGVFYIIITLFLFDDLPFDLTNESFSSIHTAVFAGQTLTKLLTIFLIVILSVNVFQNKKIIVPPTLIKVLIIIFIAGTLTGIIRGNLNYVKEFINDIRFFLNFLVGFYLVIAFLKNDKIYDKLLAYMATIFTIKGIYLFILTVGLTKAGRVYTITSDTTFYMANFFVLFFLLTLKKANKLNITSLLGISFTMLALGLSASRGKIALLALSIIFYLFAVRKLKLLPVIISFALGTVYLVSLVNPDMFNYLLWKMTSFIPEKGRGESSFIRLVEYANIININTQNIHSFIFGQGFGGYFNTDHMFFPFEIKGSSSYPDEWIQKNTYFKPHGSLSVLLLKNGFGSIILLYGYLINFFVKTQSKRNQLINQDPILGKIIIIYASCIIPSFLISYSSKLNLFGGILFGICYCMYKELKNEKVTYN